MGKIRCTDLSPGERGQAVASVLYFRALCFSRPVQRGLAPAHGSLVCWLVAAFAVRMGGVDALVRAADDLAVGWLPPEKLPMLAAEALARGVDSSSLRALAGLGRDEVREARDLFDEAMTELGHPRGSTERALLAQARRAAMDLFEGGTSEPEAAGAVAGILFRLAGRDGQHRWDELLTRFDLLQAYWEAAPELRADTRIAIRTAGHDLLENLDGGQPMPRPAPA